jgi:sulfide:quinone oxidoreductase
VRQTRTMAAHSPDVRGGPFAEHAAMANQDVPRIIVAGAGVAGLEACLALRSLAAADDLRVELLARDRRFEYRPLTVLEPFGGAPAWRMDLDRFAADQDVELICDTLAAVEPEAHTALPAYSGRLRYDALVVCVGARPVRTIPGAIVFRGGRDAAVVAAVIDAVRPGEHATLAFTAPADAFWTLPIYELAILAAARLRLRGTRARVVLATPERAPLEAFGPVASATIRHMLEDRGVEFVGGARPVAADGGELELDDGQRIRAATVVALPGLQGRRIPGLAQDGMGFVAVDEHQRAPGAPDVYAAGDITTFPLKQGGLATQQADVAAEAILAELGLPIVPRPFEPVVRGVLYTDAEPAYLHAPTASGAPAPRAYSMWWPPSKIAGRHLGPYLTTRAGAPRAPELRPDGEGVAVSLDVATAVRVQRGACSGVPTDGARGARA